jgi:alpha-beta hydrolase superfamily lysophospholipase
MPSLHQNARPHGHAAVSVVLLPAAHTGPEDFVRAGFGEAVRERALDLDLTFAALEFAHVTDRSVVERIHAEHVRPALARGSTLWLGGISLGGYVALCCAEADPRGIAGLCLMAPYLGSYLVTTEVARAGLGAWQCGRPAADDEERRVWRFLKTRPPGAPQMHLGLGREDRFRDRHELLAAELAPGEVDRVAGGHDWPTWRRLWDNFLDVRLTPRR